MKSEEPRPPRRRKSVKKPAHRPTIPHAEKMAAKRALRRAHGWSFFKWRGEAAGGSVES